MSDWEALSTLQDELGSVDNLVEALHMAVRSIDAELANPLHAIIDAAKEKLATAAKLVDDLLKANGGADV